MVLNIGGWWLAGGLAPAEAWTGIMRKLADLWPGTYFFQMYINVSLLGKISNELLARNLLITGVFGLVMIFLAYAVFVREVKRV